MSIIYVLYNYFDSILPMDEYNVKVSSATDRIVLSCVYANAFKLELGDSLNISGWYRYCISYWTVILGGEKSECLVSLSKTYLLCIP